MKKDEIIHIIDCVEQDVFQYPQLSLKRKAKCFLKSLLTHGREYKVDHFSWPNALLIIALETRYDFDRNQSLLNTIEKYMNQWIQYEKIPDGIEHILNAYCLLWLYMKGKDEKYLTYLHGTYKYICNYPTDEFGSLPYAAPRNFDIYADGIGMLCPFLFQYGVVFKNKDAIKLGCVQIYNFKEQGMDIDSGLPYHGFNSTQGIKKGIIGWGRAVGWLLLGIIAALESLQNNEEDYIWIYQLYLDIVSAVKKYQRKDGLFSWQLQAIEGPADTSATAMIIYSIKKESKRQEVDEFIPMIKKGEEGLKNQIKNGRMQGSQAECKGFGEYPQIYGSFPWGNGPFLALLSL